MCPCDDMWRLKEKTQCDISAALTSFFIQGCSHETWNRKEEVEKVRDHLKCQPACRPPPRTASWRRKVCDSPVRDDRRFNVGWNSMSEQGGAGCCRDAHCQLRSYRTSKKLWDTTHPDQLQFLCSLCILMLSVWQTVANMLQIPKCSVNIKGMQRKKWANKKNAAQAKSTAS